MQYLMLEKDTHVKLAKANGEAIRGLQPKISVWNTGDGGANGTFVPQTPSDCPTYRDGLTNPTQGQMQMVWRRLGT